MEDIAQKFLRKIQENFGNNIDNSKRLKDLAKKIDENNATYDEINDYAFEIGNILAEAYKNNLSSDVLPEGRMGFEMANDIFIPTFENNYNMVCDVAVKVQKQINIANDIGLNAIQPQFNNDRINGIINKVANTDIFDDVKGFLQSAVVNYTQSVVDDTIKANAEFHYKSGLTAIIKRQPSAGCCKWCASLAGTYIYPNVPKDVYRRHKNCNCKVEYLPEKGKRQDVWSKQWINENESSKIKLRKNVGIISNKVRKGVELTKIIEEHDGIAQQIADNPKLLRHYTPESLKCELENAGYDVRPLGKGSLKGILFEDGGGYRISYDGDKYLQYHPSKNSHHKNEYYKMSSGKNGTKRYDMDGEEIHD